MKTEETKTQVATVEASPSERFTNAVMREFPNGGGGKIDLTTFQRKLISNYFIKIDGVLRESEVKRMSKSEQYRDSLEYHWKNVNMHKLAQDVVAYSSIGLDPLQKNHINPIPYKNNKTGVFDITFIEGYNGLELKAKKFGFEAPDDVIFELKYSSDKFKSIKRNLDNKIEGYEFEIVNDFDRGELEGGFYYMIYNDSPEKNRLVVMNRQAIEKRRPEYAAAEFWGGEKDNWVNGQKQGKVEVEGWEEEMFLKTLKRHCWNSINIDSQKIDDHLLKVLENQSQAFDRLVNDEISENANKTPLSLEAEQPKQKVQEAEEDAEYEEVSSKEDENQRIYEEAMAEESKAQVNGQVEMAGPNF